MKRVRRINPELLGKAPLVEIAGENRVLIENHLGVVCYCPEEIQIKVCYGIISVAGQGLQFMQLNREQLVVNGRIDNVSLLMR